MLKVDLESDLYLNLYLENTWYPEVNKLIPQPNPDS
jgi:hypothetical protein